MRTLNCLSSAVVILVSTLALAQVTANVAGTVTDATGAVLPNTAVQLQDAATGATLTQNTDASGGFLFSDVPAGTYKATFTASGFKTTTYPAVRVEVGRSIALNATLQVGDIYERIEVVSTGQELQALDASVGQVVNVRSLEALPSLSRDATALLQLQPLAVPSYNERPGAGSGSVTSGQVAGAPSDQNTFNLDGGDITSNTEGDNGYVTNQQGTPTGVVPTPVESLEEFRVTTNNSNLFSRSAGAEVQLVTRRGGNTFHGAVYEFNQNTLYNANLWQLNHVGMPRGVWQDNRFGGRFGGPILKNHAYFFLMYEGRRFRKSQAFERDVPSTLMRQGIIQFRDASGTVQQYNFAPGAPTAVCKIGACDPRGLGMNPLIQQIFNKYLPAGNDHNEGDGLNTIGFDSQVPITTHDNDGIARFDYKISNAWDLMVSGRYAVSDAVDAAQVDIGGLLPGDTLGVPRATRQTPTQPRFYVVALTGRLTNFLTNDFHFNLLRHYWAWNPVKPFPQSAGLGAALLIGSGGSNSFEPLNVNVLDARQRIWDGKDYNINDEVSWLKGKHLLQFGGSFRQQRFLHIRDDKVNGLAEPEYSIYHSSSYDRISSSSYIPAAVQTSDVGNWDNYYAVLMGIVSSASQVLTRNSALAPNPPGTFITQHSIVNWYDLHLVDTWRVTPTFTLAYGLDWGYQTPPYEQNRLQTIMQYLSNGSVVDPHTYFANLASAAAAGQPYAPTLAFAPIATTGRKYPYQPDMHNFAPRLSIAWNPSFDTGSFLTRIFGKQQTVIRAGYGRYFDRINGVGIVMSPSLGIGFGDLSVCGSPQSSGGSCVLTRSNPANAFRIATDGNTLQVPALPSATPPIVPGLFNGMPLVPGANSLYEGIDYRIADNRKVGVEDTFTLSIQRQLSSSTLLEVGYVGRLAHHLYVNYDLNQVPYMFNLGGQTFAQAYDQVQKATNFGRNPLPAGFTTAFFDDPAMGGTANVYGGEQANFQVGDVTTLWDDVASGTYGNGIGNGKTLPLDQQVLGQQITDSDGKSNYNALYVSLRQQTKRGLAFEVNYTWSHSFDDVGYAQQNSFNTPSDQFRIQKDYSSSYFDRRHVLNGFFVYDLPFGTSNHLRTNHWIDHVLVGWRLSASGTANTGRPAPMTGCTCSGDELGSGYLNNGSAMVPLTSAHYSSSAHYLSDGSVNVFSNPSAVQGNFRLPLFGDPNLSAGRDAIRGFARWNMDAALSKTTKLTEQVSLGLVLQAVNVFNHMEFEDAELNLFTPSTRFGLTSLQFNSPRFLSIGARIDF